MSVQIFVILFSCLIDKKLYKNDAYINNLDKLVDKSNSFNLMYGLTGFYGFIAIL